ncbi:proton-conducting transporter membrane subunit [Microbacterium hominis]|uniref:proton-conducting transporter transmembrane domain-containing protein n=1 Tax=Microbacterium hominis TaxID=162426 RepID=UPI0006896943|nr:proton-conducting transporter membrane subunit [Microbacterium hominis]
MSLLAALTTAALLAAAVASRLPVSGGRRSPGFLAIGPMTAAAVIALASLVSAGIAQRDIAGAALVLLVTALTLVVQLYAERNLRGDPHGRDFFTLSALAAAGSSASIAADDIVLLAAGWTFATLSMIALLRTGGQGAQTRLAVRRAAAALLVGDAALWVAVAVAVVTTGSSALSAVSGLRDKPALAVGAGVALAAVARAGSVPFHRWLPATAAATTPVSALLHAGFVNAGALLLLRFSPVPSIAGVWIVAVAGSMTLLAASTAMLVRPDVKGRLVHSTAAQMGFMLLACSLGAFGVALVHVIGHALFKASLFLGAGSAVERAVMTRSAPREARSRVGAWAGASVVVLAAAAAAAVGGVLTHSAAVLLIFVAATAAVAGARIGGGPASVMARALLVAGLAALVIGYVLIVFRAAESLAPVVVASAVPPLFAVAVFLCSGALSLLTRRSGAVADRVFAFAFAWARPPLMSPVPRARTVRVRTLRPTSTGPFEYGSL